MDHLRPETAPTHGDDRLGLAGTQGVVEYQGATGVTLMTGKEKPQVIQKLPASLEARRCLPGQRDRPAGPGGG
jgi:hypothetical protein